MEFKDIIFLIIAIIAWIYSSYRKLQKEAVKRSKEIKGQVSEQRKVETVVQPNTIKKKINIKQNPGYSSVEQRVDETKQAQDFWSSKLSELNAENKIIDVDKKSQSKNDELNINNATSLVDEIHSGNIDWKRAIIMNEILRPVYF